MAGIGGIAMLLVAGCGDLGANPSLSDPLGSGANGGVGGGGGQGATCPPDVQAGSIKALLQENCTGCHGVQLLGGAPMPLVTFEDLHQPAKSNASKKVYELLLPMMTNAAKPMPPQGQLPQANINLVSSWVRAGAPRCGYDSPAPGAGGSGQGGSGQGGVGGEGGVGAVGGVGGGEGGVGGTGGGPGNVQCYEFRAHQNPTPGDTAPFQVGLGPFPTSPGQFYQNFVFKVPWTEQVTAIRSEPIIDNGAILHHWLLFQVRKNHAFYQDGALTTVLGQHPDSELVTGWAPGGETINLPPGVGMEVPPPGGLFELEIHYNNPQGGTKPDRSGVRLCVTTEPMPNVATLTWLGTEGISIPARSPGTAQGTCNPSNPEHGDIHILQSIPHMHKTGIHMKTVVNRGAGGQEILIDKPFKFDEQRQYDTPFTLKAGDTLTTTCSFDNTTTAPIFFGTVSEAEMCYNFVVAYPARALHNPGNSIEGAMNTCLW